MKRPDRRAHHRFLEVVECAPDVNLVGTTKPGERGGAPVVDEIGAKRLMLPIGQADGGLSVKLDEDGDGRDRDPDAPGGAGQIEHGRKHKAATTGGKLVAGGHEWISAGRRCGTAAAPSRSRSSSQTAKAGAISAGPGIQ